MDDFAVLAQLTTLFLSFVTSFIVITNKNSKSIVWASFFV
ncbi:hypothetical protein Javan420_0026 [Streptococcus phage Javan420]|nr:hypothetical protein Javan420_0026 [Streptococcus phage Javan420]